MIALAINIGLLVAFVIEDPLHSLPGIGILAAVGVGYWLAGRMRVVAAKAG